MRLGPEGENTLQLTIVGYQFAEADNEWDLNWLQVRLDARNEQGSWSKTGPALLTWDVVRLADWLDDPAGELDFTEPNLCFECVERGAEGTLLRVWLELEFRPDWAEKRFVGDRDFHLDFTVENRRLREAAAELRRELESYPERQ